MHTEYDDPWLQKSLELTLYPTTGLRERLVSLFESCGMTVATCTCHNPMQDHLYGKHRRAHTTIRRPGRPMVKCTVCGNIHPKTAEVHNRRRG